MVPLPLLFTDRVVVLVESTHAPLVLELQVELVQHVVILVGAALVVEVKMRTV